MAISKKITRQILACSPVLFNQFLIGIGFGWIAPTLPKLMKPDSPLDITSDQLSWLASIHEIGKILGTFVAPLLVDNIGRRYTLFLSTVTYFIVWICITLTRNIHLLCTTRLVFGLANGINDVTAGIYTAENSSPKFRGIIGSCVLLTFYAAILVEFAIATYMSYLGTAIVNTVLAGCAFAPLYFGIETPYFLTMKRRQKKAEKNLTWLSGKKDKLEIAEELQRIEQSVEEELVKRQSLRRLITSTANLKAIILVISMYAIGECTGTSVFGAYSSLIFSSTKRVRANEFTLLFGAAKLTAVFISPFIIEKINRRTLVFGCYCGMTFANACSFLLIHYRDKGYEFENYPWFIFGSIAMYNMFFAILASVQFALKGELLPFSVRAIGSSIAVVGHAGLGFVFAKMFFPISQNLGMEWNFLIYITFGLLGIVFSHFVLPETRGKTLHELQCLQQEIQPLA